MFGHAIVLSEIIPAGTLEKDYFSLILMIRSLFIKMQRYQQREKEAKRERDVVYSPRPPLV